jgi:protein arginine N-methyltransferase 7
VATYLALFAKAQHSNLTHPEMYVCHSNCAAAYLKLGLFQEALRHANKCQTLAETSLRRNFKAAPSYVKSFLRKGQAQLGMGLSRVAAATFDAGLKLDPFNIELKLALQKANEAVLRDLAEGKARQTMAIEYPEAHKRISYHPYAAPLHKVKTDDMLPIKLLTPFQAENDHHIKDTHNYVTVQTDIRMPKRHLRQLEDAYFNAAWQTAIEAAVQVGGSVPAGCCCLAHGLGMRVSRRRPSKLSNNSIAINLQATAAEDKDFSVLSTHHRLHCSPCSTCRPLLPRIRTSACSTWHLGRACMP